MIHELFTGYNWVYSTHIFLVSPMLILFPLAVIYKKKYKFSDNMINMLMYILIGFGVAVLFYHGGKLYSRLSIKLENDT